MQDVDVVGLDIGHSAVKLTFDGADGVKRAIFPSLACPAFEIHNPTEADRSRRETVMVNDRAYFVGETARIQAQAELPSGLTEGWIDSSEHAALVLMARTLVEQMGRPAKSRLWVVGLPVGQFASARTRLGSIMAALLPKEDRVKVLQQPDAAYFCHIYDRQGLPASGVAPEDEAYAVVDIGYYSTDFVLYEQARYVESAAGRFTGVRDIAENVSRALANQGIQRSLIDVERSLVKREIMHQGKRIDIREHVQQAVAQLFGKVLDESARLMGKRLDTLNGILVAGGSAEMLASEMVKVWPHTRVCHDEHHEETHDGQRLYGPRFVISEGYYRYGKSSIVIEQYTKRA